MSPSDRSALQARLLSRFSWTNGHADFSAVLADPESLALFGPALVEPFRGSAITAVVGLEARGFVPAGLAALNLGVGLVLVRKTGAVYPGPKVEVTSLPDWRGRRVELQMARILSPADRVLLVDDWVETGSQALAVKTAVEMCGAELVGVSVLVDDAPDDVRSRLGLVGIVGKVELVADANSLPVTGPE
jgi:adenine phosphoribosyltransferase